jgi:mono/diheme cytochrome c family protein
VKSNKAVWGLVVLVVVAVILVSGCGGAQPGATGESAPADGEVLLQDRCTVCHSLDRVTRASRSKNEWEDTVARMRSHGADLSDEEQMVLVDHLAQTYGP